MSVKGHSAPIEFAAGGSTIVVGANGSGKTKLATEIERQLGLIAHRISAQRMLALDPSIEKVSEEDARNQLRYGYAKPNDLGGAQYARESQRWGQGGPRFILNDAGALLQVLFGEQANTAVRAYNAAADGVPVVSSNTFMRQLRVIFRRVLPTRDLSITADDIKVAKTDEGTTGEPYSVTEMSDGEKAVFYMIGQTLVADKYSVFVMDEPEIHIHRSILGRLWDELEAARPDCAFLLITHDLDFAASRSGKKYVVRSYSQEEGWAIEDVPEADGFSEEIVTLILGSRRPVLFVEGDQGSFDLAFYRACYPGWTVIPRGSCESVIHSVVTMRNNSDLTRVQCAGLVDADDNSEEDRENLAAKGVQILPVSEIENLLLLPTISRVLLEMNFLDTKEQEDRLVDVKNEIFADAMQDKNVTEVVLRHCRRRIDRMLKQVDLSGDQTVEDLTTNYAQKAGALDVTAIASELASKITCAIDTDDLPALLAIYDRKKPLLALASSRLCHLRLDEFTAWVTRAIQSPTDDRLRQAMSSVLPPLKAA